MEILGVGPGELIMIMIVLLVAVGPERLPGLARRAGRMVVSFRNWLQRSPDAMLVMRAREELEQELAALRSSLTQEVENVRHEVQSVRDEVIDATRHIEDSTGSIAKLDLNTPTSSDMISNGQVVPRSGLSAPFGYPHDAPTPVDAPVTSLIPADSAPESVADLSPAIPQSPAALEEYHRRLDLLIAEVRDLREQLARRGLLDLHAPASSEEPETHPASNHEPAQQLEQTLQDEPHALEIAQANDISAPLEMETDAPVEKAPEEQETPLVEHTPPTDEESKTVTENTLQQ